jgi:hypothetical protein
VGGTPPHEPSATDVFVEAVAGKLRRAGGGAPQEDELAEKLADALDFTPEQRKRYEAAREKWERELEPFAESIRASTRITAEDLALRVGGGAEPSEREAVVAYIKAQEERWREASYKPDSVNFSHRANAAGQLWRDIKDGHHMRAVDAVRGAPPTREGTQ